MRRRNLEAEAVASFDRSSVRPDGLPEQVIIEDTLEGVHVRACFVLDDNGGPILDNIWFADQVGRGVPVKALARAPITRWALKALDTWPHLAMNVKADGSMTGPGTDETIEKARRLIGGPVERAARFVIEHGTPRGHIARLAEEEGVSYETARSRIRLARERGLLEDDQTTTEE